MLRQKGAADTVHMGNTGMCSASQGISVDLEARHRQHAKHVITDNVIKFYKVDDSLM
uniref:Uncharacterized protein n=1 Tax=Physcomitrium patens TaxID=3218 RepID=A0A2K1JGV0_PHYPA|nr:hypothetical protein PHYPA_017918 [Physcomitrium patens]